TSNLDPTVRATILAILREAKAAGRTVLFSSHVLSEGEQVCGRGVILRRGPVVHHQVMKELRRRHPLPRRLTGPLPPTPPEIARQLTLIEGGQGSVTIETPGDLSALLGWLATLPLAEVRIEPLGLSAVYEQYHPVEEAA